MLTFAFTIAADSRCTRIAPAFTIFSIFISRTLRRDPRLGPAALLPAAARYSADVCDVPFFYATGSCRVSALWMEEVLAASGLVWLLAQFGLRDVAHELDRPRDASAYSAAGDRRLQSVCLAGGVDRWAVDWSQVGDRGDSAKEGFRAGRLEPIALFACSLLAFAMAGWRHTLPSRRWACNWTNGRLDRCAF